MALKHDPTDPAAKGGIRITVDGKAKDIIEKDKARKAAEKSGKDKSKD